MVGSGLAETSWTVAIFKDLDGSGWGDSWLYALKGESKIRKKTKTGIGQFSKVFPQQASVITKSGKLIPRFNR